MLILIFIKNLLNVYFNAMQFLFLEERHISVENVVDTLSVAFTISSHITFESSAMLIRQLPFLQISQNLFCKYDNFYTHINMFHYSSFVLNYFRTIDFAFTITWNMFHQFFSFIYFCYRIKTLLAPYVFVLHFMFYWEHIFLLISHQQHPNLRYIYLD